MDAEILLTALVRIQLVVSAAILVVLLLRPLALRWYGASVAYWLWLAVPLAAMAALLPAREQVVVLPTATDIAIPLEHAEPAGVVSHMREDEATVSSVQPGISYDLPGYGLLTGLWLLGAGVLLVRSIVNTRRLASSPMAGPALVGVLRPRLVLPQDFEVRFNADEQALILAHEEMHRVSRHTTVNALVEVVRCSSWFNPLVHLAAARFRADQELACDSAVIAAHPEARHTYAEAMLKAQITGVHLPLGCVWTSGAASRLAERIERLSEQLPGRRRRLVGAASILLISTAAGYAAWAQQPAQIINVQPPSLETATVVPEVPVLEAHEAAKAATSPAPAPVRAPLRASSTAAEKKPEASAKPDANPALDPSVIPDRLLQRMDVVTGGAASAGYGSSGAMRGVVDLVLANRAAGIKPPSSGFTSLNVDDEWSSRKRNEIQESLAVLKDKVSATKVVCVLSSCAVMLTWPAPAADESEAQQRQDRINTWVQEVSKRSGFLQSDTHLMPNGLATVVYLAASPTSKLAEPLADTQ